MTGWDGSFLQDAVNRCTNPSGTLTDCPVFMEAGPLLTESEQNQCKLEDPEADLEVDTGVNVKLAVLPANVPVFGSPSTTKSGFFDGITSALGIGGESTSTSRTTPTLSYSPDPSGTIGVPGGAFIESSVSSTPVSSTPAPPAVTVESVPTTTSPPPPPATTPPPPPPATSDPGVSYEVVSTQYITTGNRVDVIIWMEAIVYVTEDSVTTTTVYPPAKRSEHPADARRNHWLRHQHQGHGL